MWQEQKYSEFVIFSVTGESEHRSQDEHPLPQLNTPTVRGDEDEDEDEDAA